MQNKLIINIILANLLWSFIPIIVSDLFVEVSIIMVIFLRFLISGFVLLILALILVLINNKFRKKKFQLDFYLKIYFIRTGDFST